MNVNNEKETTVSGESAFTPKVELPLSLFLLQPHTSKIYQVFSTQQEYLFWQIGSSGSGIHQDELLTAVPDKVLRKEKAGRWFSIPKQKIRRVALRLDAPKDAKVENQGAVVIHAEKRYKFLLLPANTKDQVDAFFHDVSGRVDTSNIELSQKMERERREKEDQWLSAAELDPKRFRRLMGISTVVTIVGIVYSFMSLIDMLWEPYRVFSIVAIFSYATMIVITLVFPKYFSADRFVFTHDQQIQQRSIGMLVPLLTCSVASMIEVFNTAYISEFIFFTVGSFVALALIGLFFWRTNLTGILLVILFLGSYGMLHQVNDRFDFYAPDQEYVEIVDKYKDHSRYGGDSYRFLVYNQEGDELLPEVSYQYWSSKTEGDTVLLVTFHGALGLRNVMVIEQG